MNDPPDPRVRLAVERTLLAYERTQIAWVRTALALISFGFAIAKFFAYVRESRGENATVMMAWPGKILMEPGPARLAKRWPMLSRRAIPKRVSRITVTTSKC